VVAAAVRTNLSDPNLVALTVLQAGFDVARTGVASVYVSSVVRRRSENVINFGIVVSSGSHPSERVH
jgi:hypothetical protein